MAQKKKGRPMPFVLGLIAGLILGWWIYPQVLFSEKEQPISYNHEAHLKAGLSCQDCHVQRSNCCYAQVPTTESCAMCHYKMLTGTPSEKILLNEYIKKERQVPWKIYQKQPDNVYFSHAAHQEYKCIQCHSDIGHSESLPPVYKNKLTGYTKQTMTMDTCEKCHAQNGASNGCYVCHK